MRSAHPLFAIGALVLLSPANAASLSGAGRALADFSHDDSQPWADHEPVHSWGQPHATQIPNPPVTPPNQWIKTPPVGQKTVPIIPNKKSCPDAGCGQGQYCHPWNPWHHECHKIDDKCGKQEVGIDFYGDDIKSLVLQQPEDCCDACFKTGGCVAYTFVSNDYGKGICYLKKGTGERKRKECVVSAKICKDGWGQNGHPWQDGKKNQDDQYHGQWENHDQDGKQGYSGCGNHQVGPQSCPTGKYCQPWSPLKYECHPIDDKCGKQEVGIDYVGDDIKMLQLQQPEQCCDACFKTDGCKAYTFITCNPDGKAYCFLKKGSGKPTPKLGAVSAKIQCSSPGQGQKPTHQDHIPAQWGSCGNPQIGAQGCPDTCYCHPWDVKFFQCIPKPDKCSKLYPQTYFDGDDITIVYGLSPWDCCKKCKETKDCKAYTFINDNTQEKKLPACYLKRGNGQKRYHATAVSAFLD